MNLFPFLLSINSISHYDRKYYIDPIVQIWCNIYKKYVLANKPFFLASRAFAYENEEFLHCEENQEVRIYLTAFAIEFFKRKEFLKLPVFFAFMFHNSLGMEVRHSIENPSIMDDRWNYCKFYEYKQIPATFGHVSDDLYCIESVNIFLTLYDESLSFNDRLIKLLNRSYPISYSNDEAFALKLLIDPRPYVEFQVFRQNKLIDDKTAKEMMICKVMHTYPKEKYDGVKSVVGRVYDDYLRNKEEFNLFNYIIKRTRDSQLKRINDLIDAFYIEVHKTKI